MRNNRIFVGIFILTLVSLLPAQQDKNKPLSPPAQTSCKFSDGKNITMDYSSPRMNGRKIFGGLVPYGQVWRAGANAATTFVTDTNVTVGGKDVPGASYTIFAIPDPDKWTLIISKKTGEWGVPYPGPENDLLRTDMKASKTSGPVENFTIGFDQQGSTCTLRMEWENTRATVDISEKK